MVEAASSVLMAFMTVQTIIGALAILIGFKFISDDIEGVLFTYLCIMVISIIFGKDILAFVAGMV